MSRGMTALKECSAAILAKPADIVVATVVDIAARCLWLAHPPTATGAAMRGGRKTLGDAAAFVTPSATTSRCANRADPALSFPAAQGKPGKNFFAASSMLKNPVQS